MIMPEWVLWSAIITVMGITCIVEFGEVLIDMVDEAIYWFRNRARKAAKGLEDSYNRHEDSLKRIDELEREMEIGKYSPAAKELDRRMAEEEALERRERQITFDRVFGERRRETPQNVYELKAEIIRELGYNASGDYINPESQAEIEAAARALDDSYEKYQRDGFA